MSASFLQMLCFIYMYKRLQIYMCYICPNITDTSKLIMAVLGIVCVTAKYSVCYYRRWATKASELWLNNRSNCFYTRAFYL